MPTIYLAQVNEIDRNYQNVVNFKNGGNRWNYFYNKVKVTCVSNKSLDAHVSSITLDLKYEPIVTQCDYLFFIGYDDKHYFYFINSIRHNTGTSIIVDVTLDVFTTYHLDMKFNHSFVDRCHVDRWESAGIPTNELVDEGLPNHQLILKESENLLPTNGGVLYCSTTPLGVTGATGGGSISPTGHTTDQFGNQWLIPTRGKITAGYPNYEDGTFHGGWDFANSAGTPIYSSGEGIITTLNVWNGDKVNQPYGTYVVIDHTGALDGKTYRVYYAHMSSYFSGLYVGKKVGKGEIIGYIGTTGNSTGNHLHWEGRFNPYTPQKQTVFNLGSDLSVGQIIE